MHLKYKIIKYEKLFLVKIVLLDSIEHESNLYLVPRYLDKQKKKIVIHKHPSHSYY
jgi:hypothetical protein